METKIIKVTDKGQISLPVAIREALSIKQGDELMITRSENKILIKKVDEDEFSDLWRISEISLKKIWDNKEDEIWDTYMKDD